MIAVADSSPLIIFAKLGCFGLLTQLYSSLCISAEVHGEVVVAGAGLPGASEVAGAKWIEVKPLQNQAALAAAQQKFPLGIGELSTILLGKELGADMVLLDSLCFFNQESIALNNRRCATASLGLHGRHRQGQ